MARNWRNNIVERGSKVEQGKVTPEVKVVNEPAPVEEPIKQPIKQPTQDIQEQEVINNSNVFDPKKTYLVVGGKIKEISSKSKYLLDMLIIEEE